MCMHIYLDCYSMCSKWLPSACTHALRCTFMWSVEDVSDALFNVAPSV